MLPVSINSSFLHASLDLYTNCKHLRVDSFSTARRKGGISAGVPWKLNSYTWRITGLQVARVSSLAFWCSQLCFSRFAHLTSSDAQTIYISPELTSILIPSCRLRITALLSSGCRATAESLSSVRSSSTVAELPC